MKEEKKTRGEVSVLRVQYTPIGDLKPADYNPRKWDDAAAAKLAESMKRFGVVDPIIANSAPKRKNVVIGGHFRLHVAKGMGIKKVPVIFLNIPEIDREKELNLRLNRNAGEWDLDLLKAFDVGMLLEIGFDDTDLAQIWDGALETEDDEFDVEREITAARKTDVKRGDLYRLGIHRLVCGDATDPDAVKKLMKGETVQMVYSDPPYNIGLDYDKGIGANGRYGGDTDDRLNDNDYGVFIENAFRNGLSVCGKDAHVFCYCDQNYIGLVQGVFARLGIRCQRVAIWVKNGFNATPKVAFNKGYEPCVYGTKGKPRLNPASKNLNEILNKEVGSGNRTIDDILDLLDIWLAKRLPGQEYEHPTQKPPTLHEKALRRCTAIDDIVLDLFGGSGSTLIACEQLKRRCRIVEIEPVFCQLIINRYEKLTGQKTEKLN